VSPSAEIAAAAAHRSSTSSPNVELTNARRRWSGVLITGYRQDKPALGEALTRASRLVEQGCR